MGKPLDEAAAEIEKSARTGLVRRQRRGVPRRRTRRRRGLAGLGPARADGRRVRRLPWNLPIWQVLRFAVPSWAAGNIVVLKHSPNGTGCALALERLVLRAGLPAGALTVLVVAEPKSRGSAPGSSPRPH